MLKLTNGILYEIREVQNFDLELVVRLMLINQGKGDDFRIDENDLMRFRDRVCVPDVKILRREFLMKII